MNGATPAERDRAARRAAQTVFGVPVVLEAGAGTGKTTALVGRVLCWCLGEGWERARAALANRSAAAASPRADIAARVASRVVAITFTEAAAAEMARRLGETLAAVAAGDPRGAVAALLEAPLPGSAEERCERARSLLAVLDRLPVRTIHAYCQGLLARHPLEAGLHPTLVVDADGALREQAIRDVVERWLSAGASADSIALAARGFGPADLAEALSALVAGGAEPRDLATPVFTPASVAEIGVQLQGAASAFLDAAGERLLALGDKRALGKRAAEAAAATLRALEVPLEIETYRGVRDALVRGWSREVRARLGDFAGGELKKTEQKALAGVEDETRATADGLREAWEAFGALDPAHFECARRVLGPLLGAVREQLRRRGVLGFDAILRETARLLELREDVARQERRAMDQLLVDEFQDTDGVQCAIVRALALAGPAAERPGLFLVGDPKQSIYGWRNADLRAYEAMCVAVRDAGGERHELCVNFRSAPPILDEVERLLSDTMLRREGVQPPFQSLVPSPGTAKQTGFHAGGARPVEHWIPCARDDAGAPASTTARRAVEIEAHAVAADVRRLHASAGVAWRDVAVLLRSLSDVDVLLDALRRAGVPYEVAKDRSYYRRREVIEAAALVRCVIDPHDTLALVSWLRSAAVGVPDAAWIPLFAGGLPGRIAELQRPDPERLEALRALVGDAARAVPTDVPGLARIAGWPVALVAALETLALLRASFRRDAPDVFVERLRVLGGAEGIEAGRFLGRYRVANLERFHRELAERLAQGGDPSELLRDLRRAVTERREVERGIAQSPLDAVQVLSIHGAKGLQFPHVYVLQLHKGSGGGPRRPDPTKVVERDGVRDLCLLGAPGPCFAALEAEGREREQAELVRLLYVATTRAKNRLVLSGLRSDVAAHWAQDSAAARVAGRRESAAADAAFQAAAAAGGRSVDAMGVAWRIPALDTDESAGLAARVPPALPSVAEIAHECDGLAAARAEARVRAARPFSGAASALSHEALRERFERGEPSDEGDAGPEAAAPAAAPDGSARVVGTAVHRALEEMRFDAPPAEQLARAAQHVRSAVRALVPAALAGAVEQHANTLLRHFSEGALHARLRALEARGAIVARELPVLLRPEGFEASAPLGFLAGAIDLLYRDEDDHYVVADYKTDDVGPGEDLGPKVLRYATQGSAYLRAVQEALALPEPPRFELWFLRSGAVVRVPASVPPSR